MCRLPSFQPARELRARLSTGPQVMSSLWMEGDGDRLGQGDRFELLEATRLRSRLLSCSWLDGHDVRPDVNDARQLLPPWIT